MVKKTNASACGEKAISGLQKCHTSQRQRFHHVIALSGFMYGFLIIAIVFELYCGYPNAL